MVLDAQFLVQAGHEGLYRNSGTGKVKSVGTSGTPEIGDEEYKLTPLVADPVAALLRNAGYTVIREDAFYDKKYVVDIAVALHFDGSATPCASGTSVGYPDGSPVGSNKPTADVFKAAYDPYIPFNRMKDNFTAALRGYYGFGWTSTNIAEFLIEYGELTCPQDRDWLVDRIHDGWLAKVTAHALEKAYITVKGGAAKIPHPGAWVAHTEPDPIDVIDMSNYVTRAELTTALNNAAVVDKQQTVDIATLQRQVKGLSDDLQSLLAKLRAV